MDDNTSNMTDPIPPAEPAPAEPQPLASDSVEVQELVVALTPDTPLAQSFDELNLSPNVLESVKAAGYTKPTPIQSLFIPRARTGRDVMGQAKTGTGKTAAFLIPIFEKLTPGEGRAQSLILAPTRELALQIHGEIAKIGSTMGFSSITLYGGSSFEPQIDALRSGVDIIVGTPGRVMDHMRQRRLDLSALKVAVLDEADRMLDFGFRKDIEYILKHCPKSRQTLLLSATIPDDIKKLSRRFMHEPIEIWTAPEKLTVDEVEQHYFAVTREEKLPTLLKLLEVESPALGIIFCGTKMGAKRLAEKLNRLYIPAKEIHGDLQQARREKIMERFRSGKVNLLIATDVASRGIDVDDITHIINYDVPYKIEDYVHRVGRTGRIGKSGKAYTFVTPDEGEYLTEIEMLINRELHAMKFDDLTSKWWPVPPSSPPEGYEYEREEYITAGEKKGEGGKGGRGRSRGRGDRERGGRDSGGRASPRRGSSEPRAHAEPRAQSEPRAHPEPRPAQVAAPRVLPEEKLGASSGPITADQIFYGNVTGRPLEPVAAAQEAPKFAHEPGAARQDRRDDRRGRPRVEIICARCGAKSVVRFEPDPTRPVFCAPCHKIHKAERERVAAEEAVAAGASHLHEHAPQTDHSGPVRSDAMLQEDAMGIPTDAGSGLGGASINLFD